MNSKKNKPSRAGWAAKLWSRFRKDPVPLLALVVSLLTLVAVLISAKLTRDQLTLAYPPRIRITNVVIWKDGSKNDVLPAMQPGEKIEGFGWAINYGREVASLEKNLCMTFWHKGPLPMYRPYNDLIPTEDQMLRINPTFDIATKFEPGEYGRWQFKTEVPADYDGKASLYVIGYIFYRDRLKTHRAILFARRYDPGQGRFVVGTDNPDYESEE